MLQYPANGFYTEEERLGDRRVGFLMKTLDGKSGYLAHQDIETDFKIRRYGVSIDNVENIAAASIKPRGNAIIILDEIGKMECFSARFRQAAIEALDSSNVVVGTITLGGDAFILSIKQRSDIEVIEVEEGNRNQLPNEILARVRAII